MIDATEKDVSDQIPNFLSYNDTKYPTPAGTKRVNMNNPITPGVFNTNNNIITYNISGSGFLDPYSLYLQFTVKNLNTKIPLQVDGSAHSFFSEITVRSNGFEFEKITDYDIILSNISDFTKSNEERKACENEGFGYSYDKSSLYRTENPLCVGNSEPILQPANAQSKDLYTMSLDRYSRGVIADKPLVIFYEVNNGIPNSDNREGNTRTFIIPVWSFFFGWGLTSTNYKYIPLLNFPNLEFSFKLNENAMFVPPPAMGLFTADGSFNPSATDLRLLTQFSDLQEFEDEKPEGNRVGKIYKMNPMEGENITQYSRDSVRAVSTINNAFRRGWIIDKPILIWEELLFDSNLTSRILSAPTGFKLLTQSYSKLKQFNFSKNNIPNSIPVHETKGSIKFLNICFLNNSYNKHAFQRKLFKYSMNLTSLYVKIGSEEFPSMRLESNTGSTSGKVSNLFFYQNTKKCALKNKANKNMAINIYNFALNYSPLDLMLSEAYVPNNFGKGNEWIARCLIAIDLERFPQTKNEYWSGVNTRQFSTFEIMMTTSMEQSTLIRHAEESSQFEMYVFGYYDRVLMKKEGKWVIED